MNNSEELEFFESLEKEELTFEDLMKIANDERIPVLPSEKHFTNKQWSALTGAIPMTQEMFDRLLTVCEMYSDGVKFHSIVEQFPELEVKYSPEICEKHKAEYDAFKAEYKAKYGDDAPFFED